MTDPGTSSPAAGLICDEQLADGIVIGAGAAGAAVAAELVAAGRQVVLLERGDPLPLAATNVVGLPLFRGQGARAMENWFGPDGDPFRPQTVYAPGGTTRI